MLCHLEAYQKIAGYIHFRAIREGGDGHRFEGKRLTKPDFITVVDALAHYLRSFPAIPEEYRTPQGRMKVIQ